jgi:hypothetical protein
MLGYASGLCALWMFLTLEDLEVLQVRVLGIDIKLDSGHRNIEIDTVENLAEGRTMYQGV